MCKIQTWRLNYTGAVPCTQMDNPAYAWLSTCKHVAVAGAESFCACYVLVIRHCLDATVVQCHLCSVDCTLPFPWGDFSLNKNSVILLPRQTPLRRQDSKLKLGSSSSRTKPPASPGLAQLLCLFLVHSEDAPRLEAALQEQHAMLPQSFKALPAHCPARLLWVHPCLTTKHALNYPYNSKMLEREHFTHKLRRQPYPAPIQEQ